MSDVILPAANLPCEARALLIAIAQGESDPVAKREGISPYFILVGGGSFEGMPDREGYNRFPEWDGRQFPTGISHAAGRYQFEPATWKGTIERFPLGATPNFRNPGDQDWGGWFLAQADYHARTGLFLHAQLMAGRTSQIGTALQPTWTSMSDLTFPHRYAAALAALPVTVAPVPEPPMTDPTVPIVPPSTPTFHPKFTAMGIGGALALIMITELNRRGITIDGNEGASITLLMGAFSSWLAPGLPNE